MINSAHLTQEQRSLVIRYGVILLDQLRKSRNQNEKTLQGIREKLHMSHREIIDLAHTILMSAI